MTIDIKQLYI